MSHFEGPSSLREETNANNNPSSLYRELKNIRISDKKKASEFKVILLHVSRVREEFATTKKAKEVTVTCNT